MKWQIQLHACGQIISVCNSERINKIGQYGVCQSYAQMERVYFF